MNLFFLHVMYNQIWTFNSPLPESPRTRGVVRLKVGLVGEIRTQIILVLFEVVGCVAFPKNSPHQSALGKIFYGRLKL